MRISEIDLYHLPGWMNAVFEQVEKQCEEELERESETYRKIIKEEHTLLEQFPFLATLADGDEIAAMKYYLLGGRGAVEIMELLEIF